MKTTELLKILSSETKAKIILWLMNHTNDHRVGQMCIGLELKQANASKHLMDLRKEGIVEFTKEGKESYYSLSESFLEEHQKMIEAIGQNSDDTDEIFVLPEVSTDQSINDFTVPNEPVSEQLD